MKLRCRQKSPIFVTLKTLPCVKIPRLELRKSNHISVVAKQKNWSQPNGVNDCVEEGGVEVTMTGSELLHTTSSLSTAPQLSTSITIEVQPSLSFFV